MDAFATASESFYMELRKPFKIKFFDAINQSFDLEMISEEKTLSRW